MPGHWPGWLLGAMLAAVPAAFAVPAGDGLAGEAWRMLTRMDVEAMHDALMSDHPGTAPEVGDTHFLSILDAAYRQARERAALVQSADGYRATLGAFANALEDRHIAVRLRVMPATQRWAGLNAAPRNGSWVVAASEPRLLGASYDGWRIRSCDGIPIADLARERLAFQTDTASAAEMTLAARLLFVDEGNPFLKLPEICRLETKGQTVDVHLKWEPIQDVQAKFLRPVARSPGFGVRKLGSGYWIALQSLAGDEARKVAEAALAQKAALRAASFVVLDMRGNRGGQSSSGVDIATAIYGEGIGAETRHKSVGCGVSYRVSPRTLAHLESLAAGGDARERRKLADLKMAMAAGKAFSAPLDCGPVTETPRASAPDPARKVFLLTDSACYSSCMLTSNLMRRLGAVQIGVATGRHAPYLESSDLSLPSGLGTFSYVVGLPRDLKLPIGPFVPDIAYDGDIADTRALENWVLNTLLPSSRKLAAR